MRKEKIGYNSISQPAGNAAEETVQTAESK
jgi:hypothetical protein